MRRNKTGATTTEVLFGLTVLALILSVLLPFIMNVLLPNFKGLSNPKTCESLGVLYRCFSDSNCEGRHGWSAAAKPPLLKQPSTEQRFKIACSDERQICCHLDKLQEYYPPGTVLLDVQSSKETRPKHNAVFRLSTKPVEGVPPDDYTCSGGAQQTCITFEEGSEKARVYLEKGFPKDAMLVVRYSRKKEDRPGLEAANPPYCGATLTVAGQTAPNPLVLTRCSPTSAYKDKLGFPSLNEPLAPRNIVANSAQVFGPGSGTIPLKVTVYYGFTRQEHKPAVSFTIPVSRSLERTLIR